MQRAYKDMIHRLISDTALISSQLAVDRGHTLRLPSCQLRKKAIGKIRDNDRDESQRELAKIVNDPNGKIIHGQSRKVGISKKAVIHFSFYVDSPSFNLEIPEILFVPNSTSSTLAVKRACVILNMKCVCCTYTSFDMGQSFFPIFCKKTRHTNIMSVPPELPGTNGIWQFRNQHAEEESKSSSRRSSRRHFSEFAKLLRLIILIGLKSSNVNSRPLPSFFLSGRRIWKST